MLFRFVILVSVLTGSVSLSQAAEDTVIDEGRFDWGGAYLGAHLGYGESDFDGLHDSASLAPNFQSGSVLDLNGASGGAFIGYNVQSDNLVYGVEADISFMNWNDITLNPPPTLDGGIEASVDWIASLRGRLGFLQDDVLIYATGGVAYAHAEWTAHHLTAAARSGTTDIGRFGYVVGGGIEKALGGNWLLRAEGLYYDFDDRKSTADLSSDSDATDFAEFDNAWTVRVGISYKY